MGDPLEVIASTLGLKKEDIEDIAALGKYLDNPIYLGLLIAALIEERKRTNELLNKIYSELRKSSTIEDLSDQDEKILELIRERGAVTAEDVKEALGYRGLNGASARLNKLHRMGYLQKIRRGKKVYFTLA